MNIITNFETFKKSVDQHSLNLHKITVTLNLLSLFEEKPKRVNDILEDKEISNLLNTTSEYLTELTSVFGKVEKILNKQIKKKKINTEGEPYAGFKVDDKPIIAYASNECKTENKTFSHEQIKQKKFEEINNDFFNENGFFIPKIIFKKEVKHKHISCPNCDSSWEYIYDNSQHKGQYLCKCCTKKFTAKTKPIPKLLAYCPHCKQALSMHKNRLNYIVHRCRNDKCSYYLENKNKEAHEKKRYRYREFKFLLNDVNKPKFDVVTKVDLNKVHHSAKTIGIILSFYINYGNSSRKTSNIMRDMFDIKISHQTICNYAEAAAARIQYLVANFKYDLTSNISGDETYIKCRGINKYVFFFSDVISKVITSYKIYDRRDTKSAVESILMTLNKYKQIPKDLLIVTDANPIYNAAHLFLSIHGINFDLKQVVGVANNDIVSAQYRTFKQVEERLNRTYKQNYYGSTGYKSMKTANSYMVLFVAFFNFLRYHSSIKSTPATFPGISDITFMYDKWVHLINNSSNYLTC